MNSRQLAGLPLHVYLVRHGETEWVLTRRHTGVTEIPLNTDGAHEAQQLGGRLRRLRFTSVFSSPRQRARQTCALAGLGQAAVINPDLAEWNYGDYDGLRSEEICASRPGWNIFRDGCPNGEQPQEVSDRADRLISGLRKLSGNVALFSHGQFGCVLAARWIGLPVAASGSFVFDTASYGVLGFDRHRPTVPVIESWNAVGREIPEQRRAPDVLHANDSRAGDLMRWELCEPIHSSRFH